MDSYDLPVAEGLSPEESQEALNAVMAGARDDHEHPLMNRDHPQHKDFLGRVQGLQEGANPEPEAVEPVTGDERQRVEEAIAALDATPGFVSGSLRREHRAEHEKIVSERAALYERLHPSGAVEGDGADETPQDAGDAQQQLLSQQAAEEIDRLESLGCDVTDFDVANVERWEIAGLRAQRLLAEGDHAGLTPVLEEMMGDVEATPESIAMFRQFAEADLDADLKGRLAETLLEWLYDAHN